MGVTGCLFCFVSFVCTSLGVENFPGERRPVLGVEVLVLFGAGRMMTVLGQHVLLFHLILLHDRC